MLYPFDEPIWQSIEIELAQYKSLRLSELLDYDKYYLYSIITHSTIIEGSSLSEIKSRETGDNTPFHIFMARQLLKTLKEEIASHGA